MGGGIFLSRAGDEAWQHDDENGGRMQLLFEEGDQAAGLWKPAPGQRIAEGLVLPARETIVVLEGTVRIEIEGGPALDLNAGDMASFPKGATTTWHLSPDFKEAWLYS
jgi:uncharacterized cupin superfamily protein